jgi:DNA-binding NarL/FixJ family response regulator
MIHSTDKPNQYSSLPTTAPGGMHEAFLTPTHKKPARLVRVGLIGSASVDRECLEALLCHYPDVKWCGTWAEINAALNEPSDNLPEILIVNGLEHLPASGKSRKPASGPLIIAIVRRPDMDEVREAFGRGAFGCITERDNKETLFEAIESLRQGETYMSESIRTAFLKEMIVSKAGGGQKFHHPKTALSFREAQIFRRLGEGKKTSEIATELVLSLKTVQAYCARAKQKRGFKSLHELQVAAARQAT